MLKEGRQARKRAERKAEREATPGTNAYKTAQAKNAAEKGVAIVRAKSGPGQGGTGKEAVGANKKSGPGVPQSRPEERGTGTKTYDRVRPKGGEIVPYQKPKRPASDFNYMTAPDSGRRETMRNQRRRSREQKIKDMRKDHRSKMMKRVSSLGAGLGKIGKAVSGGKATGPTLGDAAPIRQSDYKERY